MHSGVMLRVMLAVAPAPDRRCHGRHALARAGGASGATPIISEFLIYTQRYTVGQQSTLPGNIFAVPLSSPGQCRTLFPRDVNSVR